MDEVARTGEPIIITKNGRPVAQLAPAPGGKGGRRKAFGLHKGQVHPIGPVDLDAPALDPADWKADANNLGRRSSTTR